MKSSMPLFNTLLTQWFYPSTKTRTDDSSTSRSASSGVGGDNKQWICKLKWSNSLMLVRKWLSTILLLRTCISQVDWNSSLVAGAWTTKLQPITTPSSTNTVSAPSFSATSSVSVVDRRSAGRSIPSATHVNKPRFSPRSVSFLALARAIEPTDAPLCLLAG